jgi:hypothetical protein
MSTGRACVCDEIWLHAEVEGKLSVFVTPPWTDPVCITTNQPSGSMNFTSFIKGVLLIVSKGFAPGSIYG